MQRGKGILNESPLFCGKGEKPFSCSLSLLESFMFDVK